MLGQRDARSWRDSGGGMGVPVGTGEHGGETVKVGVLDAAGTEEGRYLVATHLKADLLAVSLMFVFFTGSLTLSLMPVVTDELQLRFGLSNSAIGLLSSVFLGFYGLAGFSSGFFAPRWGGRLLIVTCACAVVGSLTFGLSSSFSGFLVGRGIQGVGGGLVLGACGPVLAESVRPGRLGRAWGIVGSGWGLGSMVALLLMPAIETAGGFRAVFLSAAGLGLVVGIAALFQKPVRLVPDRPPESTNFRGLIRLLAGAASNYRVLVNGFADTAALAVLVGMLAWGPRFLEDTHAAGSSTSLYLLALLGAVQLVGNPAGALASARCGKYRVIVASLAVMAAVTAGAGFAPATGAAFALILIAGFLTIFYFPAMMEYIPEIVHKPEEVGPATGVHVAMGFGGSMLAPWIFGRLLDAGHRSPHSYSAGFLVLAAFSLAALVSWFFFDPAGVRARKEAGSLQKNTNDGSDDDRMIGRDELAANQTDTG